MVKHRTGKVPIVSARQFDVPLKEAHRKLLKLLDRQLTYSSRETSFWGTLRGHLLSARNAFVAATILVSNDRLRVLRRLFPAEAAILSRSLLEALGNVMALCADPINRTERYARDAYREGRRYVRSLRAAPWARTPEMGDAIDDEVRRLNRLSDALRLSRKERDDLEGLLSWPGFKGLTSGKAPFVTGNAAAALMALDDCWRRRESAEF
jgi:hypothetical protein